MQEGTISAGLTCILMTDDTDSFVYTRSNTYPLHITYLEATESY